MIHTDMMIKQKEVYETPDMTVVELKTQNIICQSITATMNGTFEEIPV